MRPICEIQDAGIRILQSVIAIMTGGEGANTLCMVAIGFPYIVSVYQYLHILERLTVERVILRETLQ
jgi:hypothetical protein